MKPLSLACILVSLAACGDPPAQPQPQPTSTAPEKHPETKKLEAADAAGYDGKALRDSVDKTLDTRDEQRKALEEAQKGSQPEPKKEE